MRAIIVLIFFSILFHYSSAQELKKITKKDKENSFTEEYHVLKSDKDIRHGKYQKISDKGLVVEKGFFKNNKMDSLWIYFNPNGIDTLEYGYFIDDIQVGPWVKNDFKGNLIYVFDHSTGKVISYNWEDEPRRFLILTKGEWIEGEVDNPPLILDGEKPQNTIARNLRYPTRAWRGGISGQVTIAFTVDSIGHMGNLRVKEKVDPDLDKEALRVISLLNQEWYPATRNGKPLTIEYYLPVKFTLRK